MRLEQLTAYWETSPALKLFRAQSGPYVLDFLHRQFKAPGRIAVPHSELLQALSEYREDLETLNADALRERPEHYLSAWCSGETRWLLRFLEGGRNEPVYQLTPHTEEVFTFFDRALQRDIGFVGTESRLRLVIASLADLVAGASHDPEVRLAHLREERDRILAEIDRVERDGLVAARYEPALVRERFTTTVALLKELLGDFRAVEERFKEITRQVQRRQLDPHAPRGGILEFALDAEDLLKRDDQGASFYEFLRFVLSPTQRDKFQRILRELAGIEEVAQMGDALQQVRRMVPSLTDDAEKVMRTNQRLSATLRRLLDSQTSADRRRVAELLADIRRHALSVSDDPPYEVRAWVDSGLDLSFPLERTFWSPPLSFEPVDLADQDLTDPRRFEHFRRLALLHRIDWQALRNRVEAKTRHHAVTLGEVVADFPLRAGMVELLAYVQIASDDGHHVSAEQTEEIDFDGPDGVRRVATLPLVLFTGKGKSDAGQLNGAGA